MIDLWFTTVDEVLDAGDRLQGVLHGEGARQLVALSDRRASDARHHIADQRRTLAGRLALRLLASARLGRDLDLAATLDVDRTCDRCGESHGQPRIDALSASTSTSGGLVLVAVGDLDQRVGVDVEHVRETLWPGFDEYVLHPDERRAMRGDEDISHRVRLWAEKEAVLKGAGLGLRAAPARLHISAIETPGGQPAGPLRVDQSAWRSVSATAVREVSGAWVTTIDGASEAWGVLAAATPQPVRRWSVQELLQTRAQAA